MVRICTKCNRELRDECFYKSQKYHCKECMKIASDRWWRENKDKKREMNRDFMKRNPDKKKEYNEKYNRSKGILPRVVLSDEERRERRRLSRAKEKELYGSRKSHRRKHKVDFLKEKQKGKCSVCRGNLGDDFHVDHRLARVKGGGNGIENLQLLCPKCNLKKSDMDEVEFMRLNGYLI